MAQASLFGDDAARSTGGSLPREVAFDGTWEGWREAARGALALGLEPPRVAWRAGALAQGMLGDDPSVAPPRAGAATPSAVPRAFLALGADVACCRTPAPWTALYRVLWRLTHGERALLDVYVDEDVHALHRMAKAVRREGHKLRAFVRFRLVAPPDSPPRYVAWFEPAHDVLAREAPFFARRFPSMAWSILTPERAVHWDGDGLRWAPGVPRAEAPSGDVLEELWRTYYAHTFNPARVKPKMMRAEMPVRYWKHLPEASLIAPLLRDAPARVRRMIAQEEELASPPRFPVLPRRDAAGRAGTAEVRPAGARSPDMQSPDMQSPDMQSRFVQSPDAQLADVGHVAGTFSSRGSTPAPPEGECPSTKTFAPHPSAAGIILSPHDEGPHAARERSARARALLAAREVPAGQSPLAGHVVRVGTASWTDPTMTAAGVFYPDDARDARARLAYYASRFSFVEVDATYYALPSERVSALWAERTPDGFTFDVKAHALMTGHATSVARLPRDLREALPRRLAGQADVRAPDLPDAMIDETWRRFTAALAPLSAAGKLGALLLQLPRTLEATPDGERVVARLRERAGDLACAVEFRHASWLRDDARTARTLAMLRAHDLAFVMVDAPPGFETSMPPVTAVTSDRLAVLRLHGRRRETWERPVRVTSERYRYLYDAAELGEWVPRIVDVAQRTQGVHVVMNNCHANYGTTNADEITALLVEFDRERRLLR